MPTLAELRERTEANTSRTARTSNRESLVADARMSMRSTEFIERKLQSALLARSSSQSCASRSIK